MENLSRNPFNPLLKHSQNLLLQLGFHNFLISTSFLLQLLVFHNFIVPYFNFSHWLFCLHFPNIPFCKLLSARGLWKLENITFLRLHLFAFRLSALQAIFFAGSFMHCGMQTMKTQLSIFSDFFLSSFPLPQQSLYRCISTLSFSPGQNAEVENSTFHDFDSLLSAVSHWPFCTAKCKSQNLKFS